MAWTIIDNFETGTLDANWTGDTASFAISSSSPIAGTYDVTKLVDDISGVSIIRTDSLAQTSRNSSDIDTLRFLTRTSNFGASDYEQTFFFFVQDVDNLYAIRIYAKDGNLKLFKTVGGSTTQLAAYNFSIGAERDLSLIIKATTNNLDVRVYDDLTFTTLLTTLNTSDTTYASGGIGLYVGAAIDTAGYPERWDNIEKFEVGEAITIQGINQISGVQSITI